MKTNAKIFTLLAVVGFFIMGCGDSGGGGNGGDGGNGSSVLKGMGPACWTYVIDTDSAAMLAPSVNRSSSYGAMFASGIAKDSNYELKIIMPDGSNTNPAPEIITVTITDITTAGNKTKLTLVPVDPADKTKFGNSFKLTLDEKGNMYRIDGLKGIPPIEGDLTEDYIVVPIGDNSNNLDGMWFWWDDNVDPSFVGIKNAIIINGNSMVITQTNYYTGKPEVDISYYRIKINVVGDKIFLSDYEGYDNNEFLDWTPLRPPYYTPDPGEHFPEELIIVSRTATTLRMVDEEGNDITYTRVTTEQ